MVVQEAEKRGFDTDEVDFLWMNMSSKMVQAQFQTVKTSLFY